MPGPPMPRFLEKLLPELAIDLGTSNTLLHDRGALLLDEPSAIAFRIEEGRRRPLAVGRAALRLQGRTDESIRVVEPIRDGVIADLDATVQMLRGLVARALGPTRLGLGHVLLSLPHDVTAPERAAFRQAALQLGARRCSLIEEPLAAAIGSGLPVLRPSGRLVVDVGSGIIEVVVISLGAIAAWGSSRTGAQPIDESIAQHLRAAQGLVVGRDAAERLKLELGRADLAPGERVAVKGRSLRTGLPAIAHVRLDEVAGEIFARQAAQIGDLIISVLDGTPAELVGDVCEHGVYLTGGGALLPGLDRLLAARLGVRVRRVPRPLQAVALGNGRVLSERALRDGVARG